MKSLIGKRIEESGYRKGYIADKLEISRQQLSNWIGGRSYPPLDKAYKLAKLLNCKVDDLYDHTEEERP